MRLAMDSLNNTDFKKLARQQKNDSNENENENEITCLRAP